MPIRTLVGIEIHRNPEAVGAQAVRFGDGAPEVAVDGRKIAVQFGIGGPELTQRQVAVRLGISRSYVSRLETRALSRLRRRYEQGDRRI